MLACYPTIQKTEAVKQFSQETLQPYLSVIHSESSSAPNNQRLFRPFHGSLSCQKSLKAMVQIVYIFPKPILHL